MKPRSIKLYKNELDKIRIKRNSERCYTYRYTIQLYCYCTNMLTIHAYTSGKLFDGSGWNTLPSIEDTLRVTKNENIKYSVRQCGIVTAPQNVHTLLDNIYKFAPHSKRTYSYLKSHDQHLFFHLIFLTDYIHLRRIVKIWCILLL